MIATLSQPLAALDAHFCLLLTYGLVHFVWQGCLLALAFALAQRLLATSSPSLRYAAGVVTLMLMAACLPVTMALVNPAEDEQPAAAEPIGTTQPAPLPAATFAMGNAFDARLADGQLPPDAADDTWQPSSLDQSPADLPSDSPALACTAHNKSTAIWQRLAQWGNAALAWSSIYAAAAYTIGLALMLLRVCAGMWMGNELRRESIAVTDLDMINFVRRQAGRLALRAVPTIAWCRRVSVPMVVGVVRPMILLPFSLAVGVTDEQLELILLHEMAHIQRYDLAVNLLQRLIEALLFFHPAVWWLSRQVSLEREEACDDAVLGAGCQGPAYADTLVRVAELCTISRSAGFLAATGEGHGQLRRRIMRLFDGDQPAALRPATPAVAMLLFLTAGVVLALAAWRTPASAQNAGEATAGAPTDPALTDPASTDPAEVEASAPAAELASDESSAEGPRVNDLRFPGANTQARVLHFPSAAPVGVLATRSADGDYVTSMLERNWHTIGLAQGDVEIPAGCDVRLAVRGRAAADLSGLSDLAPDDIQFLQLCGPQFTGESLSGIGHLTGLRLLWLGHSLVNSASLAHIKSLTHLEVFMIRPDADCRGVPLLDEEAIGALAQLPSLRKVGFHDCSVTAAGMARLVDLPNLTFLRLYHTSVEFGGIEALADAPALRGLEIWLERLSVMHVAMPQIGKLHQLKTFFLSGTANSADLAHLVGLTNLESLTLETSVDNLGAFYLAQLPALKCLSISDSKITDSGLGQLARLERLRNLSIGGFFTDQGLRSLATLKSLRQLEAGSPFVTQVAADLLAASLPRLKQINVRHVDPLEDRPAPAVENASPQPAPLPADDTSAAQAGGRPRVDG